MLFSWLRGKVREAFLAGCADAVAEIAQVDAADASEVSALSRLQLLLRPALAAPVATQAVPVPAVELTEQLIIPGAEAGSASNGRRRVK